MITKDLIHDRINSFWGYGILESPVWLVGIEEKFDDKKLSIDMLEQQFNYARKYMRNGMINADRSRIFEWKHLANMEPFLPSGAPQRTWRLPVALYLYFQKNIQPTEKDILEFQRNILADGNVKEVATLELSPLPAFSTNDWFYDKYEIPELKSRREYQNVISPSEQSS